VGAGATVQNPHLQPEGMQELPQPITVRLTIVPKRIMIKPKTVIKIGKEYPMSLDTSRMTMSRELFRRRTASK